MKITLLSLVFVLVSEGLVKGDLQLKAFRGGSILIKCKCPFEGLSTERNIRYTQFDNTANGVLSVRIQHLTPEDSGMYLCRINSVAKHIKVRLDVKEDVCCGQPLDVIGQVGGSVDISCRYPQESTNISKHLCKLSPESMCGDLIASKTDETRGRFSIVHDRDQKLFTVTIRDLTMTDSGVYWCGVRTGAISGSMALITEVNIQVKAPPPSSLLSSLSSSSSSSSSSQSSSSPSSSSSSSPSSPTTTITTLLSSSPLPPPLSSSSSLNTFSVAGLAAVDLCYLA
ncbi:polymeric immunoglobulin receptor-like [Alosa pseudoharengus]|uniref:polymeric immunoglobulin receptor-like n=1 Tax=Alosa pseudoharengus TaxID=34774 RepID=UPI003F8C9890